MKAYGRSSPVVTVLSAAVGAVLVVATVESLVTAGTPDMPVVKEATSLPADLERDGVVAGGGVGVAHNDGLALLDRAGLHSQGHLPSWTVRIVTACPATVREKALESRASPAGSSRSSSKTSRRLSPYYPPSRSPPPAGWCRLPPSPSPRW